MVQDSDRTYSQIAGREEYLSESATKILLLVGTVANWLVWRQHECQIEYVTSGSDNITLCSKPALANCTDCGTIICSDCQLECCGDSYCEPCHDYHVTHSCVRKPVQYKSNSAPTPRQRPRQARYS